MALPTWGQVKEITCYSDVFAPYVTVEGNDIPGIDVDTIAEAGRRAGIKVRFQLLPWVRLERDLSPGATNDVECAFARRGSFDAFRGLEDFEELARGRLQAVLSNHEAGHEAIEQLERLRARCGLEN